jgi:hypothetical protein
MYSPLALVEETGYAVVQHKYGCRTRYAIQRIAGVTVGACLLTVAHEQVAQRDLASLPYDPRLACQLDACPDDYELVTANGPAARWSMRRLASAGGAILVHGAAAASVLLAAAVICLLALLLTPVVALRAARRSLAPAGAHVPPLGSSARPPARSRTALGGAGRRQSGAASWRAA